MNIIHTLLAIDTSNQFCSIALRHNGAITELHERAEQQHSAVVLPMVRQILDAAHLTLDDVDAFVVGIGPGGFTGVRLAVAVVQGLAFASDKKVLALSSLSAMAQAAYVAQDMPSCTVTVAMDARMNEIYHATFQMSASACVELHAPSLSAVPDFITTQNQFISQPNFTLVGNALEFFGAVADWCAQQSIAIAAIDHSAPHAADLLTQAHPTLGNLVAPEHVVPLYVRDKIALTTAERAIAKAAL